MPARTFEKDLAIFRIEKIKNPITALGQWEEGLERSSKISILTSPLPTTLKLINITMPPKNEMPLSELSQLKSGIESFLIFFERSS